jgi:protein ImuA
MTPQRVPDDDRPLPSDRIAALRQQIRRIEGFSASAHARKLALGVKKIDTLLGGGLSFAACHDCVEARPGDGAALAGFALALAARLQRMSGLPRRVIIWISERLVDLEYGRLYGPGLHALGLDPALFLLVSVETQKQALAAAEDALKSEGPAMVVIETQGHKALDAFSARRLTLCAEAGNALGLLLRHGPAPPLPFSTRLALASHGSAERTALSGLALPGNPGFDLAILKNRLGQTGRFALSFDHETATFSESLNPLREIEPYVPRSPHQALQPALPRALVSPSADRPAHAA